MYKPLKSSLKSRRNLRPKGPRQSVFRASRVIVRARQSIFGGTCDGFIKCGGKFSFIIFKIKFAQLRLQYASLKYCFLQDTAYFISSLYGAIFCRRRVEKIEHKARHKRNFRFCNVRRSPVDYRKFFDGTNTASKDDTSLLQR